MRHCQVKEMSLGRNSFYGFLLLLCISVIAEEHPTWSHGEKIFTKTQVEIQVDAVKNLIHRLIPERADEFVIIVEPGHVQEENGYFQIEKMEGNAQVIIRGSTGVMAAWGFHYYLTQLCQCHVSWDSDQLTLPNILPNVSTRIASLDKFRYYQNTCTVSYSSAWWQWPRWEREIDWMAMNGINLPLAFTGQEAIWQRVYLGLGLEQKDLDEHFAGPAFFAWQRMGNLRGWGGPLSNNWIKSALDLQHMILDRMRSFGMIPVLPAFAGHVPRAMERVHPNTTYIHLTPWADTVNEQYCCPLFIQPTEPLFAEIGFRFVQEMITEFGTDSVYNCDIFNEVRPTSSDPIFLSSVGAAVFNAMKQADPNALWVMQGWLFKHDEEFWTADLAKALLTSVPQGRMLILDLQAELNPQYNRLQSFYGQPFIFCMLHNFGGTLGLYGATSVISKRVIDGRNFPNSTMVGTGLTMEGIDQNYVAYDQMLEMGWRNEVPDLNQWFNNYTIRRYGINNSAIKTAWGYLMKSVYNDRTGLAFHGQYILATRPRLFKSRYQKWYNPGDVISAWDAITTAAKSEPSLKNSLNFRHDYVDITRQSVVELFDLSYSKLLASYCDKNTTAFQKANIQIIDLLQDLDKLLQTESKFLLGKWIADAKSWGVTEEEKIQYEWNARNQITIWGLGEGLDYATKQWAGVVVDYFKPRWEYFIKELETALQQGRPFNKTSYEATIFKTIEEPFTHNTKLYSDVPLGDSISTAIALHDKWSKVYQSYNDTQQCSGYVILKHCSGLLIGLTLFTLLSHLEFGGIHLFAL